MPYNLLFNPIIHDAWLETYGPYARRPPSEEEVRTDLYSQLDGYFKENNISGDWIETIKPIAVLWAFYGTSAMGNILLAKNKATPGTAEYKHLDALAQLASKLRRYS